MLNTPLALQWAQASVHEVQREVERFTGLLAKAEQSASASGIQYAQTMLEVWQEHKEERIKDWSDLLKAAMR